MNWNEYLELSEKTMSKEFFSEEKRDQYLLHAVIGVLTEVEELIQNSNSEKPDLTNLLEEVGDITWYLAIIGREMDINWFGENTYQPMSNLIKSIPPTTHLMSIVEHSCGLLDFLKKKLYYNKPIDDVSFRFRACCLFHSVAAYLIVNNLDPSKVFEVNISKLKARYGEKFSTERAINRDLETEREILESRK
jgi:NTP pyrophosphatase (non-canonical NTP hydrolase)